MGVLLTGPDSSQQKRMKRNISQQFLIYGSVDPMAVLLGKEDIWFGTPRWPIDVIFCETRPLKIE